VPGLTNKRIRRNLLKAFLAARFGMPGGPRKDPAPRDAAMPGATPTGSA
jgi:hypothetical protein